jgi:hypothetical protein
VVIVPLAIKQKIWEGKEVNLALLINPALDYSATVTNNGMSVTARPHASLSTPLPLPLFMKAFGRFKEVMKERFPGPVIEDLNAYKMMLLDMATQHPGYLFYEYHTAFAAKAAAIRQQQNKLVIWAKRDTEIFNRLFYGSKTACRNCGAADHPTDFCHLKP